MTSKCVVIINNKNVNYVIHFTFCSSHPSADCKAASDKGTLCGFFLIVCVVPVLHITSNLGSKVCFGWVWPWWHMPVIPSAQEAEVEGSLSKAGPSKHMTPYLKNKTKTKRVQGMFQVVKCLRP
jgi:hypothetical protein